MNKRSSSFKVLISAMLVPLCFYAQNDWDVVPIPADAGSGNQWVLDAEASDDFNYTFNPTTARTSFGPASDPDKWINFFHNNFQGPGATNWEEDNVAVSGGFLRILNDRDFNLDGSPVTKTYVDGGVSVTRSETQSGCITAAKRVLYPVFVEASLQVMNSSLASDVWLLSPDDTEEIDIIEAYGGPMSDNRNAFFASRIHLSHHVFIRSPFKDYQPADWNSWYRQTGVSQWGGRTVRIGVYWKSPTIIQYYIDGVLVRELNNDAIRSLLPNGTWEYTYPAGVTSTESNGQLEKVPQGQPQAGFQAMNTATSLEEARRLSNISVIDPFNYLNNGRRFSKELDIIINTEDQSWQGTANRSPNDTEILNTGDNTMLVDWIRVYKPQPVGDRARSLTFDNKSNYIEEGEVLPTFSIGQIAEVDITYSTGITGDVEEDLHYIAAQIRQLDENDMVVAASSIEYPINGNQANSSVTSFQYEIPNTFNDGTTAIPTSDNLPAGHRLELNLFMSLDEDTTFESAAEEITLIPSQIPDRTRSVFFENVSDYVQDGFALPTLEVGQTIDMELSYATGISNGVEEDLNYVAVMLRQFDGNGGVVNTSAFNAVVTGDAVNADTMDVQFTVPNTFNDGTTPIPLTADLPEGHKLTLLIFMSVDGDAGFANGSEDIEIVQQQPRARSISFGNASNYTLPGGDMPTFDIGQTFDMTVSYATGVSNGVEEDLHYIATMLRQVDGAGATVRTSAFNTPITGDAVNSDTVTYQFTIPSTYSDNSPVLRTDELPEGHKLVLVLFMSVNADTGFANGNQDIELALPGARNRVISFDNRSDYVLEGETATSFEAGQTIDMELSYSTGATVGSSATEEDLGYIAVMLRQVDENGTAVKTSAFNVAIAGTAPNFGTVNYQYTIPERFDDNSLVPTTENLPAGHKFVLLIFMSVDGDSGFANANSDSVIVEEGALSVESVFNNDSKDVRVSPNPFTNTLQINSDIIGFWKLYNLQGQEVLEGISNIVEGDSLEKGIYFLVIEGQKAIKIVKE